MAEEVDKIKEIDDDQFPDHIPVIPYDIQREREKENARKLADELRKKSGKIEPIVINKSGVAKKASQLTIDEQENEIIRCITNPIYFIETYLTIFDQTQGKAGLIVPFRLFDFQKTLVETYVGNRFVIANKYRQAGVSTTTCAYIAWYVMFNQNRSVAIVADKLETARDELMNDVVLFIEGCPEWLRPKTGRDTNEKNFKDTQKLKRYDNGSSLGAFSSKGLRGYTPTLLFWDETAWTEKGDKFWTSAKPTLQTGGAAIMVSCVTKDTYLYTNKGIKQMQDFIPNEALGAKLIEEYNILGKDKVRKGNLFFNNGFVDTLKIKTTFSELESSYNHKYWAYRVKDNKYEWYKASELELGDYISIQYGMNIWGDNDDCSDFKPTTTNKCRSLFNPKKINKDIAYLIGLYISEGCGNKRNNRPHKYYGITITCGDDISQALKNLNLTYYNKDGLHYEVGSLNVSEFFEYLGFDLSKKAKEKVIPSRLFEMSRENIIAMIQGIMDGDGWSTYNEKKNKLRVGIGLSSKELVNQLRMLFNNFGVLTEYKESITPPTKKVKVSSKGYCITANNSFAVKYFNEIGFRFERKQIKKLSFNSSLLKHTGVVDNIPNGKELMCKIYNEIKYYGILQNLKLDGIKIESWVNRKKQDSLPSSRQILLKIIEKEKNNISKELLDELMPIIGDNLYWSKIKTIEKSQNFTYDFSLPDKIQEKHDFHHSVIYNQIVTHNTPSGLDAVFYKTFDGARRKENNFKAVELWWYNDPRYNKNLCWLKNKKKENEIRIPDENWSNERRIQLMDDGWEASSPWFEEQVRDANGDMRKISQELLCVEKNSLLKIGNVYSGSIEEITIEELYKKLIDNKHPNIDIVLNDTYKIFNGSGEFVNFFGVHKIPEKNGLKITLENNASIIVSEDHIFLANGKNMYAKSLVPNVAYLTTESGDFYVKSVEIVDGCDFYDIIDSENCEYYANGFSNHNCSFLGSGDNFIAEEYLLRIQDHEVQVPIRQEYMDLNMWIWKDPEPGEEYIMSLDASPGHGEDNSTVNIMKSIEIIEEKIITKGDKIKKVKIKRHKMEQVAEYYGKIVPQMLAEIAYQYGRRYNNAYCVVDITGGYGVQAVEKLLEFGYDNVHYAEVTHKPSRDRLQGYIKKGQKAMSDGTIITVDLIPGFFIGNNRASVLLEMQRAVHLEDVIIKSIRLLNELKTFVTVPGNRVADHKRSFHDDSIMGLSIGLYVLNFDMARFKMSKGVTEKLLNAFLTVNDINEIGKKQEIKNNLRISPNSTSPLNPYQANAWLFNGLSGKKKI
jgi:hypothetical protein